MKNLWLKGNKLTGPLPASVAVRPELEYLDIHANELAGPLPAVWDTPKLKIFRGEDNCITGALPEALLRQPALEQLFLHNNALSGSLPAAFSDPLGSLLLASLGADPGGPGQAVEAHRSPAQIGTSCPVRFRPASPRRPRSRCCGSTTIA